MADGDKITIDPTNWDDSPSKYRGNARKKESLGAEEN